MAVISERNDAMIRAMLSGCLPNGSDIAFLTAVKAHLDAHFAQFKFEGDYTPNHVRAAALAVRSK